MIFLSSINAQSTEEEPSPSPSLLGTKKCNSHRATCNTNTPKTIQGPPCRRFDLKGDFLYWYANQSGLGYTTKPQSTLTTSDFSDGTLVKPTFDWKPGLRVDAIYGFDRSYWSLGADVILYRGTGKGSENTKMTNGIFPAFSFADTSLPTDYANEAKIHWTLHTTLFDVLASYEWIWNSCFTLVPSFGLRNTWLTEKANVQYEGGTYQAGTDTVHLKSSFYGIGPRLALKPQFRLSKRFSFYAEGASAVFAGWFDVHQSEKFLGATRATLTRKISRVRWEIDTTAGFVYTYDINKKMHISFDFGFDYLLFFHQKEFVHGSQFNLHSQGKALTLYGGHAGLGFCF